MENKVYVRPRFRKLANNEFMKFWYSLRDARSINEHGNFVLLRDTEVYEDAQTFLIGDGVAGFAIKDEEMISVHKNNKKAQKCGVQHILPKMVRCAFKHGAKYGDCYGEWLANYYMKSGFIVIGKVEFDSMDNNPINWEYDKFGKPFIYIMMRGVRNVAELDKLKQENALSGFDAVKDNLPLLKSYEEAEEYRSKLYNKVANYGYKKRLAFVQAVNANLKTGA